MGYGVSPLFGALSHRYWLVALVMLTHCREGSCEAGDKRPFPCLDRKRMFGFYFLEMEHFSKKYLVISMEYLKL